jgi:hypothetical protein
MAFTKESARLAGHKGGATKAANRDAAVAAVAVMEPPMVDEPVAAVLPAQGDVLAGLMALAKGLEDKQKQESAIGDLTRLLDKIDFRAYPDLAKSEAIQTLIERVSEAAPTDGTLLPGMESGKDMTNRKVEWTWRDVMENKRQDPALEYVEWEPRFSDVIIWNGLKIRVTDGQMIRTPRAFKDTHDEARRGMKAVQEHAEWLSRKRNNLSDSTMLGKVDDLQGMKARGYIEVGSFAPGGGLNMLAPDKETYEMAARLSGEAEGGGDAEGGEGEAA